MQHLTSSSATVSQPPINFPTQQQQLPPNLAATGADNLSDSARLAAHAYTILQFQQLLYAQQQAQHQAQTHQIQSNQRKQPFNTQLAIQAAAAVGCRASPNLFSSVAGGGQNTIMPAYNMQQVSSIFPASIGFIFHAHSSIR